MVRRFIHSLLVVVRQRLGQICPNSIRKICAFIVRCSKLKLNLLSACFGRSTSLRFLDIIFICLKFTRKNGRH